MTDQVTSNILMIRPVGFRFNEQTAVNNFYQQEEDAPEEDKAQELAEKEFDQMVVSLRYAGINIVTITDPTSYDTPDSIFPNNWVTFHSDGTMGLYPMFAENRRKERNSLVITRLQEDFEITKSVDLTNFELSGHFLEGSGSLILDRVNKIAYAALSARTSPKVISKFEEEFGYRVIKFVANQTVEGQRLPIYHTNVMMCLGETFAVICLDAIDDELEKYQVIDSLQRTGKEIISITEAQVLGFAGNMLQVKNKDEKRYLVMSTSAYQSLTPDQISKLEQTNTIIHSPLDTIETCGGGSARCMMAEIFLPEKVHHEYN